MHNYKTLYFKPFYVKKHKFVQNEDGFIYVAPIDIIYSGLINQSLLNDVCITLKKQVKACTRIKLSIKNILTQNITFVLGYKVSTNSNWI